MDFMDYIGDCRDIFKQMITVRDISIGEWVQLLQPLQLNRNLFHLGKHSERTIKNLSNFSD